MSVTTPPPTAARPRVHIVGGGFAGLACARRLARAPVDVTIVDQRNHHVFQPLLYQVATAALSPADIAAPIRHIVRKQRNCRVVLARITGVDLARRHIEFEGGEAGYDWLVLAAGASHAYFGHDDWAPHAPGLKSIEDATEIRRRILLAFESAEYEANPQRQRATLTFAVVGGGATGVELAGAIKEIAVTSIPADFRSIDTATARVILFEAGERLLPTFPPDLSARARRDLEAMGVEVRLRSCVTDVSREGLQLGTEFVAVRTVLWAAGVQASPLARSLGVPLDRAGRVIVGPDLAVPGQPTVFVAGDMAAVRSGPDGAAVPGVAQGAIQMGDFIGRLIAVEAKKGGASTTPRPSFVYDDKGTIATIGRARAVAQVGRFHVTGLLAWLLWATVHIIALVGFRNRLRVMLSWTWSWITFSRDARLITGDAKLDVETPRPGEAILAEEEVGLNAAAAPQAAGNAPASGESSAEPA